MFWLISMLVVFSRFGFFSSVRCVEKIVVLFLLLLSLVCCRFFCMLLCICCRVWFRVRCCFLG